MVEKFDIHMTQFPHMQENQFLNSELNFPNTFYASFVRLFNYIEEVCLSCKV